MNSTVDTNVLLHASDESSRFHDTALRLLGRLADGPNALYVFWPVVVGYVRLATHPGVFERPLTNDDAVANIEALLNRRHVVAVDHDDGFWQAFPRAAGEVYVKNDFVAHGYLVALMRLHGVPVLWTRDPDFRRFDGIVLRDPFSPSGR